MLYDEQGTVVDSAFGYSKPATVAPGQGAGFEIQANHDAGKFKPTCNSESFEFVAGAVQVTPELPAAALVLACSLACLAVVYRFRNNL